MTFTAIARCPRTGQLGVATQSHWPFVGTLVPWGRAGVGVIATQASTEPAYGPRGSAILSQGVDPQAALHALLEQDKAPEVRQVAMLDRNGNFAHFTGGKVVENKDTVEREGAVFIGNMLTTADVVPAMARSWDQTSDLTLGWRLLKALEAAQGAGGDLRGQQAAALLVVGPDRTEPWEGVIAHIRIDDDPEPLERMAHLLNVREAYNEANLGEIAMTQLRVHDAITHYEQAQQRLPRSPEIAFWRTIALTEANRLDDAVIAFDICKQAQGEWTELARRLQASGRLHLDEQALGKLIG